MAGRDTVPLDCWVCCQCGGPNLIALMSEICPACGNMKCGQCSGPGSPMPESPRQCYTMSASPAFPQPYSLPGARNGGGGFRRTPKSRPTVLVPQLNDNICGPAHVVSSNAGGYTTVLVPNYGDVWTCHSCGGANLEANSPECCPVCGHFKCGECS